MIIIVGLGNPGSEYTKTRHNFGFMVMDALADAYNLTFSSDKKFKAEIADVTGHKHAANKVLLAKPQTFMNLSGESVIPLVNYYKVEPKNIWVVADDLDLPLGKIRIRANGGETGGHHGLDSIVSSLGSNEFKRIRLGIRDAEIRDEQRSRNIDAKAFVTSVFEAKEWPQTLLVVQKAVECIKEALESGELQSRTLEVDGFDEKAGDQ